MLAGIETHVCVLHTALDLLADDFRVFIAVDAVGAATASTTTRPCAAWSRPAPC